MELGARMRMQPPEDMIPYVQCGNSATAVMAKIEHTENMNAPYCSRMEHFSNAP